MSSFVSDKTNTFTGITYNDDEYGAFANNLPDYDQTTLATTTTTTTTNNNNIQQKYYITTAISYTNGLPHIGHAYEFITADIIARYHRIYNYNVFFLTGTDEHGQKVASSAEKVGLDPIDHCDIYVDAFKSLDKRLLISYNGFQRTTNINHILTSQKLWKICANNNDDIYLDAYEGWYNEREEAFVTNATAEASDYKDPGNGLPLKLVKEESYFFRMSNYLSKLIIYIEENPSFIKPDQFRNDILSRLKKEGLKDLSISRTTFNWGIPVPEGFDTKHVMYVWFDALTNYLTGVDALNVRDGSDDANSSSNTDANSCDDVHDNNNINRSVNGNNINSITVVNNKYWPADKHIIGKDIIWFHCVIWPCMLMSANIPLPKGVFSHGFVNAVDGRKMSKSYNNTICPNEILDRFPVDTIRYYLCAATTYGSDVNFSEESMISMHNSELADVLGNLIHRVLNLTQKYCEGIIPDVTHDNSFALPFDLLILKNSIRTDINECSLNLALFKAMDAVRATNRFLTEAEPWKMKGDQISRRLSIVRTSLEAIYAFTHFLAPILPLSSRSIFKNLSTEPRNVMDLRDDLYNLIPGTITTVGDILFQKIEDNHNITINNNSSDSNHKNRLNNTTTNGKVTICKSNNNKATASTTLIEEIHEIEYTKIDLRIGRIVRIWEHETSDRLYCEDIDIGNNEIRQVASGLRAYYKKEDLLNRLVVVVCNLKESKFQGFVSCGMVLAAKCSNNSNNNDGVDGDNIDIGSSNSSSSSSGGSSISTDVVQLVDVPSDSQIGERINLREYEGEYYTPYTAAKVKKLKVWENISVDLHVNDAGVACWKDMQLCNSAGGVCTVQSIINSPIS